VQGPLPRLTTLAPTLLLVACTAACTSGSAPEQPTGTGSSHDSAPSTTATPAPPPSVPMQVRVTHLAGTLGPAERKALASRVGHTISTYVDAAFLAGDYPRSGFAGSFGVFTRGAARLARDDQALLTNQSLGATTRSVQATRRTAYLSVLAPRKRVAGVTAAVDLVFRVERVQGPAQRVEVRGRLLLGRNEAGAWRIFGYDVTRAQTPARPASTTPGASPSGAPS